jgi:anti-sigma factor RsiW
MDMERRIEQRWLRRLLGELSIEEARRLDEQLERDAGLRSEFERLGALWHGLDSPTPSPAPTDFAARVLERLAVPQEATEPWPIALRWAASAMVVSGIALGVLVGHWAVLEDVELMLQPSPSLAESYVVLLESAPVADEEATR